MTDTTTPVAGFDYPTDPVESTGQWFAAAKQMPEVPTPSVRQSAFYVGIQVEELAEKLEVIFGENQFVKGMKSMGHLFKDGQYDYLIQNALKHGSAGDMLDADVDLMWVSIGAARAQGADFPAAYAAVIERNWAKRFNDGQFHLAPNGKVLKPEGWFPADLTPFLHETLRDKK